MARKLMFNAGSIGLASLILGTGLACSEKSTDSTATDENTADTEEQSRTRPDQILARLQANIQQDLPSNINQIENAVQDLQEGLLKDLANGLTTLDSGMLLTVIPPITTCPVFVADLGAPTRTVNGVSEYSFSPEVGTAQSLQNYVAAFQNVEHVSFDVHEANLDGDTAVLKVWFDLRGIDTSENLRQDRGWMTFSLSKKDGKWQVNSIEMPKQEVITAKETYFVDATQSSGLATVPLFKRLEALRRGGYAITVGDYDNDNDPDIYVGGWGASNLYSNDGSGNFTDVTAQSKIGNVDRVKAAAFTDLDNDGNTDLVLSRFIDDKSEDLLVYKNDGKGQFKALDGAIAKALNYDRAMPLTVADFNGDGFNDLYVGFPGARDFTYLDANPNPLNTQGLFLNNGDATFKDATLTSGLDVLASKRVGVAAYPHASVKADFDGDGKVDLMVADDRRGPSQVFKNDGSGKFSELSGDSGLENKAWAMGIAVGDYNNDGLPDIYYSNIDFLSAKRIDANLDNDNIQLFHGNRLYKNLGEGKFEDVTDTAGLGWAGEAAAGSMWFDYDNDGDLDLYVLNGLWTGPGDQDMSSIFSRAYASELLIEQTDPQRAKAPLDIDAISLRNPGFNNMVIQTLMHFSGDMRNPTAKNNTEIPSLSLGGNQRNTLFRNNGDGTFTELGYLAGVDTIDDGYMPAFADVDKDGALDLLVRNCDPGTDKYTYPSLRLYKNQAAKDNSLSVRLTGKNSSRDAVGAKVTIRIGETVQVREIDTVSGAAQSEMMAFFGLGSATKVDELTIHWPSGTVDSYQNITKGSVNYTEK